MEEYSFTKLFIFNPKINSKNDIEYLNKIGIEAMHLESSFSSKYQNDILSSEIFKNKCINYKEIHDKIISIPLFENNYDLNYIIESLKKLLIK